MEGLIDSQTDLQNYTLLEVNRIQSFYYVFSVQIVTLLCSIRIYCLLPGYTLSINIVLFARRFCKCKTETDWILFVLLELLQHRRQNDVY